MSKTAWFQTKDRETVKKLFEEYRKYVHEVTGDGMAQADIFFFEEFYKYIFIPAWEAEQAMLPKAPEPELEVGLGVTQVLWSDRHAYSVIEVVSPKKLIIQADNAIRTDSNGMSDSQSYRYEPNPNGDVVTITLRKDGRWYQQGYPSGPDHTYYHVGSRREYYDYSF